MPDWLPPQILYSDFNGDWNAYLDAIYQCFKKDFLDPVARQALFYDGQRIALRRHPLVRGKEASFWHLISTGDIEEERIPDIDRCERISWARALIDNAGDPSIKRFENRRGSNTNICLWLECSDYLVVLGKRSGYLLLLTAYTVAKHKRRHLQRDFDSYNIGRR